MMQPSDMMPTVPTCLQKYESSVDSTEGTNYFVVKALVYHRWVRGAIQTYPALWEPCISQIVTQFHTTFKNRA